MDTRRKAKEAKEAKYSKQKYTLGVELPSLEIIFEMILEWFGIPTP